MADATINIELKGISQIRSELKALKGELANATDPQQMAELAAKAGELSDKLKDANEKVAVFAAGSPFERTNNALGLMGSQLASLDFEGASESAKSFAVAAKGINGEQIATQLRGLGGVVTNLGKGFMSLGATLLTNPIFLIAGAIAGIVAIIGVLLNKLGFLKPILNAIGDAFRFIGQVIDGVVQSIKDFLDWMGLTAFAAEDAAERQVKALEKVDDKRKKDTDKLSKDYDHRIRLARIEGKNTFDLEREKQEKILKTTQARYKDLLQMIKNAEASGKYSDEEIKKMRESAREARETAQATRREIEAINLEEKEDNRKKNEDKLKQDQEAYKKAAEARREAEQKRKDDAAKQLEAQKQEFEQRKAQLLQEAEELNNLVFQAGVNRTERERQAEENRRATLDAASQALTAQLQADLQKRLDQENAYKEARLNLGSDLVKGLQGLDALLQQAGVQTAGLQKTIALVQIATDTAKAISATIAGASAAAAAGGPAAPFLLAGYIASGIGTVLGAVASAWAALKEAPPLGGAVSGSAPTPSATATSAAQPNVQLFGQNNNANNLSAPTSMEQGGQNITVTAVVSETEVTNTQNKIKKIQQAASL